MTITSESKPDGGIRIEAEGITLDIDGDALERAEREGGLGFNYAETPMGHELLTPPSMRECFDSPIEAITHFRVAIQPKDPSSPNK